MPYPCDILPMVHSTDIKWILTCMSNEVYHETIDGRKVSYVDLTYGLGGEIKLVVKGRTLS